MNVSDAGANDDAASKLELPWPTSGGNVPVLIAAASQLARRCDDLLVVLGHRASRLESLLDESRPAKSIATIKADPDAPMYESFRVGLNHLAPSEQSIEAVVLHPGDHPVITDATAKAVEAAFRCDPTRAAMPAHDGRGGHPVIIPGTLFAALRAYSGEGGLRAYWRAHPDACRRVPVEDPWGRIDLDTAEAYREARQRWLGELNADHTPRA